MINGQRVVVVLPAYNAARTLAATVADLPDIVDERVLVDDASRDDTFQKRRRSISRGVFDTDWAFSRRR